MKNTNLPNPKSGSLWLLLIFVFVAAFDLLAVPAANETRIVIFHANDIHGKIDNFAKVAWIIAHEKKNNANVFYFIAGDNFTGNPVVDQFDPPEEPLLELLNRLQLDLMCLGNHEFDFGQDNLKRFMAGARFSFICANIQAAPDAFPQLRPYAELKSKDGVKMAVFGLIQIQKESGLPSTHPARVAGLHFSDPLTKALEFKKLRAKNQILIALTHIGFDDDMWLARQMPELDVIIGGHSHTMVHPAETVNGTLIAQSGSDNKYLGRIELLVKDGRVTEKKGELIGLSQPLTEDAEVKAMIEKFNRNPVLARVIAKAPFVIQDKDALGSLMTDAMRKVHGLDIAFQNGGGIRLNQLPLQITLKDIYALDPFGNQVVQINMAAAEIRLLLKNACARKGGIDLQVSGITYKVRADRQGQIQDVILTHEDGKPLAEDRTYKVGLNSYVASSYKFAHRDPGRSLQATTADALIRFLESGADLTIYRNLQRAFWQTRE